MNLKVDYVKLIAEDLEFARFVAQVMKEITGADTEGWILRLYKDYNNEVTPEQVAGEVKANI